MKPSNDPTYRSWYNMWWRVRNHERYEFLSVEPSWENFEVFKADMGERPEGTTLDRYPNPYGGYVKGNTRWATPAQQQHNRRLHCNSQSGLRGVCPKQHGRYYEAYWNKGRKHMSLLSTKDFFEACCARKSWEAKHGKGA